MTNSIYATRTYYTYDAASRLLSVGQGTNSATYSYLANSPLLESIEFKNGSTSRMTTTNRYDNLNRLLAKESRTGATPVSSFNYVYNSANQRTAVTNTDSSERGRKGVVGKGSERVGS